MWRAYGLRVTWFRVLDETTRESSQDLVVCCETSPGEFIVNQHIILADPQTVQIGARRATLFVDTCGRRECLIVAIATNPDKRTDVYIFTDRVLRYHLMRRVHHNWVSIFQGQSIASLPVGEPWASLELLPDLVIVLLLCSLPLHAIFGVHFTLDSLGFGQL